MSQHAYGLKKTVLIETSWNVKNYQLSFRNRLASINRNIVECKEHNPRRKQEDLLRINRNIVECKVSLTPFLLSPCYSINRNIVECKDKYGVVTAEAESTY